MMPRVLKRATLKQMKEVNLLKEMEKSLLKGKQMEKSLLKVKEMKKSLLKGKEMRLLKEMSLLKEMEISLLKEMSKMVSQLMTVRVILN